MKLALIFSLLAPMVSFASAASAATSQDVCGKVIVGEQCDVDYCVIRYITTDARSGKEIALGLMDGGMILLHDYQTADLAKFQDKNVCIDASKINEAFGLVDVKDLKIK